MITIFRQIRKALATNSKVIPYLHFGIGEILLVAIGILIALHHPDQQNE
jgi:hypothetical protein